MYWWPGPCCRYYKSKRGHLGEWRCWCTHPDRETLTGKGVFIRLINWIFRTKDTYCIMTQYDDEDYCELYEKRYPRPQIEKIDLKKIDEKVRTHTGLTDQKWGIE